MKFFGVVKCQTTTEISEHYESFRFAEDEFTRPSSVATVALVAYIDHNNEPLAFFVKRGPAGFVT